MEAAHGFFWEKTIITWATWAAYDYLITVVLWYLPRVAYKPPILTTQPLVGSPSLKFTADWHPANRCGETNLGNVVGAIYLCQGMFKKNRRILRFICSSPPHPGVVIYAMVLAGTNLLWGQTTGQDLCFLVMQGHREPSQPCGFFSIPGDGVLFMVKDFQSKV